MVVKRMLLVGWLALGAACATPATAGTPPVDAVKPLPLASGPVTVREGSRIALQGATVAVDRITYLNEPCPAGVQCIHSGVIKRVQFTVTHSGAPVPGGLSEGTSQTFDGVEVRVVSVSEGPAAVLEASLPVK